MAWNKVGHRINIRQPDGTERVARITNVVDCSLGGEVKEIIVVSYEDNEQVETRHVTAVRIGNDWF